MKNQFSKNINKETTFATSQNDKFMRIESTNNNFELNKNEFAIKVIY